jgi:hypothetical protein
MKFLVQIIPNDRTRVNCSRDWIRRQLVRVAEELAISGTSGAIPEVVVTDEDQAEDKDTQPGS